MEKLFPEYKKYLTVISVGLLLAFLFIKYPAPIDRLLTIQGTLITVAGILSGFAIAYLSAKIFNIRSERENRQNKIDDYCEKITDFRRLVYYIAQKVLDARTQYPKNSLADLYDPLTMPPSLLKAHNELDKVVDLAYRSLPFITEANRMVFLFELYEKYTADLFTTEKVKKEKKKENEI